MRRFARRLCSSLASPSTRAKLEEQTLGLLQRTLPASLVQVQQLAIFPSGDVSIRLRLATAACHREEVEATATAAVESLPWSTGCSITSSVAQPVSFMGSSAPESLRHVGALVGVSSCKGGVGKSTVAVNLAYALAALGARVGLADADIHGPSLPSLVTLPEGSLPVLRQSENNLLRPPEVGGVKLMSYGFIAKGASTGSVSAAVMRGPMVGKVVTQLISGTDWGELDYLLVDLPPGTGDVHLTLSQTYSLTGALIVTTPQRLSRVDVFKGIDMWRELKVPLLSVIENMAHFTDPRGEVHYPFGRTQLEAVRDYSLVSDAAAFRIPIEPEVTEACDEGSPVMLSRPASETAAVMRAAAQQLVLDVARLRDPAAALRHHLRFDPARGLVLRVLHGPEEGGEFVIPRRALAALEGGPGSRSAAIPAAVSLVETGRGSGADKNREPAAMVRWEGGGQTVIACSELMWRARALAKDGSDPA